MKRILEVTTVLSSLLIPVSCSFPGLASNANEDIISITSRIASEAQILASLVAGMIEHCTDKNTAIINNPTTTTISHQAMMSGDASISAARYTGTDLTTTLNLPPERDPKKAFATVKDEFEKRYGQTWFPSYDFENTHVFLVRKDTAQEYHLSRVSDLKNVADELVADVDAFWINHKGDGYGGFQETYGFSFDSILLMRIGLVYDAAETGKMDAILGYFTDGRTTSYGLVMLEDDRQLFLPYDVAPVVDNKILADMPHLKETLDKLGRTISTEKMQELNCEADNNLVEPSVVTQHLLRENHYFEGKWNSWMK